MYPCSSSFHWPPRLLIVRAILVVAGGFLVHLSLGTIYTFGNMAPYIVSYIRNQSQPVNLTDTTTSWIFASALIGQGGAMFMGGWLVNKIGPRFTTLIGGWIMSVGVAVSFFTIKVSFWLLIVSYGILFGVGVGVAYIGPLSSAMKWMPRWKGLANGVVVAGFGLGSLGFNALQTLYINPLNLSPQSTDPAHPEQKYFTDPHVIGRTPWVFLIMGGTYATMQLIGSLLITDPPPGYGDNAEDGGNKDQPECAINKDQPGDGGTAAEGIVSKGQGFPERGVVEHRHWAAGPEDDPLTALNNSNSSSPSSLIRIGSQLNSRQSEESDSEDSSAEEEKLKLLKATTQTEPTPLPDQREKVRSGDLENSLASSLFINNNVVSSVHPRQVLQKPNFYLLWFMFLSNGIVVIFTSTLYKIFGLEFIKDDHYLAAVGSVAAIFNCAGRIVWGLLADLVSYKFCLVILSAAMTILMLTFYSTILGGKIMYFVWVCVIFFCVGGNFSLFPTAIGRAFGLRYAPINYGLLFTSQIVAGSLGALLSTLLRSLIGFDGLMFLVSGFSGLGLILALVYKPKRYISLQYNNSN